MMENSSKKYLGIALAAVMALASLVTPTSADEINCSNEFRSGKLYFSQGVLDKAVGRFALAAETCPEKGEYRARYAMALAQYGATLLEEAYIRAVNKEEQEGLLGEAMELFRMSGAEFDSSVVVEPRKKNKKFVRENRQHYWVEHYNLGLKLAQDDNFGVAAREFEIARLLDPTEMKAYQQGAVVLIKADRKTDAAALVEEGLAIDPEHEALNELLGSIFVDAAQDLTRKCETSESPEESVAAADEAVAFLEKVLEKRPDDPNTLFDLGLAKLCSGTAVTRAGAGDGVPPDAIARFDVAADYFKQAADLVPPEGEDRDFHLNALFNRIQAILNAEHLEEGRRAIKQYVSIVPTDAGVWQLMAQTLVQIGAQEATMMALVVSKSLQGTEVPVDQAVAAAQKEERETFESYGRPDAVWAYQEPGSGDQINTWFWLDQEKVASFKMGLKSGELTWALED